MSILAIVAMGGGSPRPASAADGSEFREYAVKAEFIVKALKLIEWQGSAPGSGEGPIELCILGDSPFGKDAEAFQGKTVKERTLQLRIIKPGSAPPKECRVLFVCQSESERVSEVIKALDGKEVLTIGDTPGYGERGVIMNFFQQERSVRFQVNLDAARRANVKLDSRLLKLATLVSDK